MELYAIYTPGYVIIGQEISQSIIGEIHVCTMTVKVCKETFVRYFHYFLP
jgi:hypothetical protein